MPETLKTAADGTLSDADAAKAGAAAKGTRIVAFPTESGYALGSTGLIKAATRRLLQIKERSTLKPLPVLVASAEDAKTWVEWTPLAEALAAKLWPGPLVLVLKTTERGRLLTFPEYQTLAVRVPAHPAARAIVAASGVPWVWTSANKSGEPPQNAFSAVAAAFGSEADLLIDGGDVPLDEATAVDASGARPRVLRQGAVPAEAVLGAAAA